MLILSLEQHDVAFQDYDCEGLGASQVHLVQETDQQDGLLIDLREAPLQLPVSTGLSGLCA